MSGDRFLLSLALVVTMGMGVLALWPGATSHPGGGPRGLASNGIPLLFLPTLQTTFSIPTGFFFGIATAIIVAMKPIYLVFPLAFGFLAIVTGRQGAIFENSSQHVRALLGPIGIGVTVIWLPLIAYFSYHDALQEMLWTSFVYPTEALRDVPTAPIQRLASSASWWARIFAPYLPLLALGVSALRRPFRPLLSRGITLYLLLACAVILVQKTSWWEYHFVLLFPPLGLLASLGLDRLLSLNPGQKLRSRVIVGMAGLPLLLPTLSLVHGMAGRLTRLVEASRLQTDASLPIRLDRQYLRIWERTRFHREDGSSRPGPIYVFGDSRIVLLAERRQAIAVHGHVWHHLPERLWQKLPTELIDAEPAYVFMGGVLSPPTA